MPVEINPQALIEQLPAVTYVAAIAALPKILYVSPQIETLLGFAPADWCGDAGLWVRQLHPDDRSRIIDLYYRSGDHSDPFVMEYRVLACDGRILWVRDSALVLRDAAGQPRLMQGVLQDITESKQAKEEIRQLKAALERQLAERSAERQAVNEALQELGRFKGEFISTVSHELRTPLANAKLMLALLERGKPEKRAHYMAVINREIDLFAQLIEDLLDLSRIDTGKVQPVMAAVNVNEIVAGQAEDRTPFVERGLTLEVDLAPVLPEVQGDQRMLSQALAKLTTNAIRYTPRGGVIRLRTALRSSGRGIDTPERGDGSTRQPFQPQYWVTFSVEDTGPGIAKEEQARLFERFFRGAAGRKSDIPGTGLGLAICKEIVSRHGGKITFQSQVGVGSTFTVWLPVHNPEGIRCG